MARFIRLSIMGALLAASSLVACASDSQDNKEEKVTTTKSGLKYVDLKEGTGDEAKA
jgi:FKBP-type peptidyl-prolyl cis-trans isomerase